MTRDEAARRVAQLDWIDDVVVFVWIGLTALMAWSGYLVYRASGGVTWRLGLVAAVVLATWLYPVYTAGFSLRPGFVANIAYGIFVLAVIVALLPSSRASSALLAPILVWIPVATWYVWLQIRAGAPSG